MVRPSTTVADPMPSYSTVPAGFAVQCVNGRFRLHIVQPLDVNLVAHNVEVVDRVLRLFGTIVVHTSGMMPGSAFMILPLGAL
jgi:hypothetical protein